MGTDLLSPAGAARFSRARALLRPPAAVDRLDAGLRLAALLNGPVAA